MSLGNWSPGLALVFPQPVIGLPGLTLNRTVYWGCRFRGFFFLGGGFHSPMCIRFRALDKFDCPRVADLTSRKL